MKLKYESLLAAAVFATAPAVTYVTGIASSTEVMAATVLTADQLNAPYIKQFKEDGIYSDCKMVVLKKAKPYITAKVGETVEKITNRVKRTTKDLTSSYGHVSKIEDLYIYPTMDDGFPDFGNYLKNPDKLKSNVNYVGLIIADLGLLDGSIYNYATPNNGLYSGPQVDNPFSVGIFVPVHVTSGSNNVAIKTTTKKVIKKATTKKVVKKHVIKKATKKSTYGYVSVRRGHKVATYTSTGRFSKHYVYGHKTYKLTAKKNIKHRGLSYKLSGKNQWVQKKYLRLK